MKTIIIVFVFLSGVSGIANFILGLFTIIMYRKLSSYVEKNHSIFFYNTFPMGGRRLSNPFENHDNTLITLNDLKVNHINNLAKKTRLYFLVNFGIFAFLISLTFIIGMSYS